MPEVAVDVVKSISVMGRRPSITRAELEEIALRIFSERGFEVVSIEEIAAAAGIGRRTFFRYFKSKNDAVWGDFDTELEVFEKWFNRCSADVPVIDAISAGVLAFNSFDPTAEAELRNRMQIILRSPALQAYSTLKYTAWRSIVARFAANRLGLVESDLVPRTLGHLALGAAVAAYEQWLDSNDGELIPLLQQALTILGAPTSVES